MWASCAWVSKLCVDKLCVVKLCVSKLYGDKLCVVCVGRRERAGRGQDAGRMRTGRGQDAGRTRAGRGQDGGQDAGRTWAGRGQDAGRRKCTTKNRTPHKDVGKTCNFHEPESSFAEDSQHNMNGLHN